MIEFENSNHMAHWLKKKVNDLQVELQLVSDVMQLLVKGLREINSHKPLPGACYKKKECDTSIVQVVCDVVYEIINDKKCESTFTEFIKVKSKISKRVDIKKGLIYALRKFYCTTFVEIARVFKCDHSTLVCAATRTNDLLATKDPSISAIIQMIDDNRENIMYQVNNRIVWNKIQNAATL